MDFHISQFLSPGRKEFVKGTLLLTGAGLFCRVLGFFYRIYMSRTIGAEGLGLYNMIHPLFSIAFAVCAGSIQTALSQYIAANQEKGPAVFKCGLFLSLSLSVIPLLLLWKGKMFLAGNILSELQAACYLPVLAVSVPFACLHACINGYFYGKKKLRSCLTQLPGAAGQSRLCLSRPPEPICLRGAPPPSMRPS